MSQDRSYLLSFWLLPLMLGEGYACGPFGGKKDDPLFPLMICLVWRHQLHSLQVGMLIRASVDGCMPTTHDHLSGSLTPCVLLNVAWELQWKQGTQLPAYHCQREDSESYWPLTYLGLCYSKSLSFI